jgi:hypothetical protein
MLETLWQSDDVLAADNHDNLVEGPVALAIRETGYHAGQDGCA